MGILVHSGRARMAELIFSRPIHLAIGTGGADWEEATPTPDYDDARMKNEVGRKTLFRGLFVIPDDDGILELPNGRKYTMSATPTRHLYLQFVFRHDEGDYVKVRELGVFVDTVPKSGLPAEQSFFRPEDLENQGTLLFLSHLPEGEKFNPQKNGNFQIVIAF